MIGQLELYMPKKHSYWLSEIVLLKNSNQLIIALHKVEIFLLP